MLNFIAIAAKSDTIVVRLNSMENTLRNINKAAIELLMPTTPDETYKIIVEQAVSLVDASSGSIFLLKDGELRRVYASDMKLTKTKIRKKGFVFRAFELQKPYVLDIQDVATIHPELQKMGIKSMIFIPLSYKNEAIGVLSVNSIKEEVFSNNELDILRIFGTMASLSIKKANLYTETKKALEIRDMFISMAAHELRTPLTSINGYIQLLHSRLGKTETTEGKWVNELYEESKRLTNLVKELLEVNRIKSGQIQFMWQESHLHELLLKAIARAKEKYSHRVINYTSMVKADEDLIIGDQEKLPSAFENVIDNALKYSHSTTPVDVILTGKTVSLSVVISDKGKGIDKQDLPNIFEGHHKGREGGEEGMGIGLFFVDSVIRQHHGTINVKSAPKKGTTFEIKIPRAKL